VLPRKPITGIAFCCAPAKSGYAAAPARTVMKFRRLIPKPLDPTLGMDYGSREPRPKGWTNGDFPPIAEIQTEARSASS
jgi:hypothetical protein